MEHLTQAPLTPSTETLQATHPLSAEAEFAVIQQRSAYSEAMQNHNETLIGIVGPCHMQNRSQLEVVQRESGLVVATADHGNGLETAYRAPTFKPRSRKEDWHGEETTDPEGAYETMRDLAESGASTAIEVAHTYHLERYAHMMSLMWRGGRNDGNRLLLEQMALHDKSIPLLIKNNLNGTIDDALEDVERARELRGDEGAPVALLYRGGKNAQTPEAWEEQYMHALEATDGLLFVDTAHGGEMAHDPKGDFEKSVEGQERALGSVIHLAMLGYLPAGVMMEASELKSSTDPHMSLKIALDGLKELHHIKMRQLASV